jgi:hypothetical protein
MPATAVRKAGLELPEAQGEEVPVTDGSLDGAIEDDEETDAAIGAYPTHEDIAMRAYAISEARRENRARGDELSDWLRAEEELMRGGD